MNSAFRFVLVSALICATLASISVAAVVFASFSTPDVSLVPDSGTPVSWMTKSWLLWEHTIPQVWFVFMLEFNLLFWERFWRMTEKSHGVSMLFFPETRRLDQAKLMKALSAILVALATLMCGTVVWRSWNVLALA
jgi:hypothetical protein